MELNGLKGLTPDDLPNVKCDKCENNTFRQEVQLKRISAAISPTGAQSFLPIPCFACSSCGHINEDMIPKPQASPLAKSQNG